MEIGRVNAHPTALLGARSMRQSELDDYSVDGAVCPTCGNEYKNTHGMRIHHAQAHGEKLGMVTKVCEICDDEYETIRIRADGSKYCSNKCKGFAKRNRKQLTCEICDEEFEVPQCIDQRFCDDDCRAEWMRQQSGEDTPRWDGGKTALECPICEEEFRVDPNEASRRKFCSRDCRGEHLRQLPKWEHPRYEGVDSYRYYEIIRDALNDEYWGNTRERIRGDSPECETCGAEQSENGYALDVHHIVPITAGGCNADELLMTMCHSCHMKAEAYTKAIPEVETLVAESAFEAAD